MAVYLLSGVPGSGKTHHAVKKFFWEAVIKGRPVYHNIEGINLKEIKKRLAQKGIVKTDFELESEIYDLEKSNISEVYSVHKIAKENSLIIIDESQNYYHTRDWNKKDKYIIVKVGAIEERYSRQEIHEEFNAYLTKHRHQGHDVILLTQDPLNIDSGMRRLVEYQFRFRKASMIPFLGSGRYVCKTYAGAEVNNDSHLNTTVHKYDSEIFPLYQSYSGSGIGETDLKAKTSGVNLGQKMAIIVSILLMIFFSVRAYRGWTRQKAKEKKFISSSSFYTENSNISSEQEKKQDFITHHGYHRQFYTSIYLNKTHVYIYLQSGSVAVMPTSRYPNQPVFYYENSVFLPVISGVNDEK